LQPKEIAARFAKAHDQFRTLHEAVKIEPARGLARDQLSHGEQNISSEGPHQVTVGAC